MTVAEMLERISSSELSEWMELLRIEYEEQKEAERKAGNG